MINIFCYAISSWVCYFYQPSEFVVIINDNFAILVNGLEVDYDISDDDSSSTLRFYVEEGTEEIEIIGTHVIPEFPVGVFFGFILMTSIVLMMSKSRIFR